MTSPANILNLSQSLLEQCRVSKEAVLESWIVHHKKAMDYKALGDWKTQYSSWAKCCEANPKHFFNHNTYRGHEMNFVMAEIVEAVTQVTLSKTDARNLREKFYEVVPDKDRALIPSIWQLCHSYATAENRPNEALVPRKDVIAEAYEIIKEERDNNSISVGGVSVDIKALAQSERIKERVYQGIQSHAATWQKAAIVANQAILAELAKVASNLPLEGVEVIISWKVQA